MKKLGSVGIKYLKICHIVFVMLMFGGIISSVVLRFGFPLTEFDQVNISYENLKIISDHVIRYGAQGIIITSLIYSIWTPWGFKKYNWVAVKWIIFVGQTLLGIFFVDRWIEKNISMLETEKGLALTNPAFLHNHTLITFGAFAQILLIIILIWLSVFKPWTKRSVSTDINSKNE